MGLTLVTAPTIYPVTLSQAKSQVGLAQSIAHHNEMLNRLISSASAATERLARRAWLTQTWKLTLTGFPGSQYGVSGRNYIQTMTGDIDYRCIYLPRPPLASVSSISYVDSDEASQTLATTEYNVRTNSSPGLVALAPTKSWPTTSYEDPESVTITYVAGYTAASLVPDQAKQAILALVGHWFENRTSSDIPSFVADMLDGLHCGMKLGAYEVTS